MTRKKHLRLVADNTFDLEKLAEAVNTIDLLEELEIYCEKNEEMDAETIARGIVERTRAEIKGLLIVNQLNYLLWYIRNKTKEEIVSMVREERKRYEMIYN